MTASVHYLPLVSICVLRDLAVPVSVFPIYFWNNVIFFLVVLDVFHETNLTLGWLALLHLLFDRDLTLQVLIFFGHLFLLFHLVDDGLECISLRGGSRILIVRLDRKSCLRIQKSNSLSIKSLLHFIIN